MELVCRQVSKRFSQVMAVDSFSLEFSQSEITGLLGVNGAGKSTLIKMMMGLVHPDAGEIGFRGDEPGLVGFMPEIAYTPETITPWRFIQLALRLRSRQGDPGEELRRMALAEHAWHKPMRLLSKGMRQRVGIAYALAGQPHWVILDEPMTGLDAIGRVHVLNLLKEHNEQGMGIVICSHIVPDLVRLCHRVVIVGNGKKLESVKLHDHNLEEVQQLEEALVHWSRQCHGS